MKQEILVKEEAIGTITSEIFVSKLEVKTLYDGLTDLSRVKIVKTLYEIRGMKILFKVKNKYFRFRLERRLVVCK